MSKLIAKDLLAAGGHFGHRRSRFHPSVKPYIYTIREKMAIIDLDKTDDLVKKAIEFMKKIRQADGRILCVATKERIADLVKETAIKIEEPYCWYRWIGGGLTNFEEAIKRNLRRLQQTRDRLLKEESFVTKREKMIEEKKLRRLEQLYGGMENLKQLPEAIFIVDPVREKTIFREAKSLDIPIVAIADTEI
ncbi:MAG: small subunit ribosomal protein S2 [Candidatus Berkelbacteria bacterium Licking1014_2]|uniref:Small ribosomal subunit protein uS2 n=1 Tax=Candidatus Berkelbacteria bacterium Licking1014_2 TaxID=2017146 RepID=A0A554LWZ8_9BACT|nr:MAG: small subunit ribosomal protein S2 [Candidatus Berkelbacteria bacterium Licking1014_2]